MGARGDVEELKDFWQFLVSKGYSKEYSIRVVNQVREVLRRGGISEIERDPLVSKWMKRKYRSAWRRYNEFRTTEAMADNSM